MGLALSRLGSHLLSSTWPWRRWRAIRLRIEDTGALRGAAQELPFVRNAYFVVLGGQFARKRIKRRRKLQDSHGGLVDFGVPAAAPNHGLQELAVGTDGHFDHRGAGELLAARDVGE